MNILSEEGSASVEQVVQSASVVNCIASTCTGGAVPHQGGAGASHGDPNLGPKHCDPSDHVDVVVGLSYGPQ